MNLMVVTPSLFQIDKALHLRVKYSAKTTLTIILIDRTRKIIECNFVSLTLCKSGFDNTLQIVFEVYEWQFSRNNCGLPSFHFEPPPDISKQALPHKLKECFSYLRSRQSYEVTDLMETEIKRVAIKMAYKCKMRKKSSSRSNGFSSSLVFILKPKCNLLSYSLCTEPDNVVHSPSRLGENVLLSFVSLIN